MLSKAELDYLQGSKNPSYHYSVVLKQRIETKLQTLEDHLTLLAKDPRFKNQLVNIVTKIRDQVTEKRDQPDNLSVNALNCEASQRVKVDRGGFEPPTFCVRGGYSSDVSMKSLIVHPTLFPL